MTDLQSNARRTFIAGTVTLAGMVLLKPIRAIAQEIQPMAEHRYARANYIPNAPERAVVGTGKTIKGTVVSAETGRTIPYARVEFYLNTTPNGGDLGEQNPANRGSVRADADGFFRFETDPPLPVFASAEPHIHTRAAAEGWEPFFYRHVTSSEPSEDVVQIVLMTSRA